MSDGAHLTRPPERAAERCFWHPALTRSDSSAVCMRSVAAALSGQFLNVWDIPLWQRPLLHGLAALGQEAARRAVEVSVRWSAAHPRWADSLTADDLARSAVNLYPRRRYAAMLIGAPSGGLAHVATALDAPFLSQHFLSSYARPRSRSSARSQTADDIQTCFEHGMALARRLLARNPDLAIVHHYDPLHDRFLVKSVTHLRYKLLDLPAAYREFIHQWLVPGGTLIFADCRYAWRQYRVGERHTFQVGGLGGVSDQAFLDGGPEIEALTGRRGGWALKLAPLEVQPESEWGTLPPLRERVEQLARENGYRFVALEAGHPEEWARLGLAAHRARLTQAGRAPAGVLIECFTQVQPWAAVRGDLLPLWLPFNCTDSLAFLRAMTRHFPAGQPVLFNVLPNFTVTFDMVTWAQWLEALHGFDVTMLGVRESRYPSDPVGLFAAGEQVAVWCQARPSPAETRLTVDELESLNP